MELKLYNTLTRRKGTTSSRLIPPTCACMSAADGLRLRPFGNARPVIVFDVLFRLLRHIYGPEHVGYVRNITDVDDKINARAARSAAASPSRPRDEEPANFKEDVAALGNLPPTVEPRATEHISADGKLDMIAMIERLIEGLAYAATVMCCLTCPRCPTTASFQALARRDDRGARVEVAPYKRDAMDFVLWKPSKPGSRAGSPWGAAGRAGISSARP